jgi:hypothetical protein
MAWIYTDPGVLRKELRPPSSGSGYVSVADLPWPEDSLSVLEDADPAALEGDVIRWDLTTSPSGYGVEMRSDGTFALTSDDGTTQQTFSYSLWRYLVNTWYGPETVTLEGEIIGFPRSTSGGRATGLGKEPLVEGETGSWFYTEQGVLEDEVRAFAGLGRSKSAGVGTGLGETPFTDAGRGTSTSGGRAFGTGVAPVTGFGIGQSSSGGRASGTGFSPPETHPWVTIHKTDTIWIKIK